MKIAAITGRSGSGKSSVAAYYASLGHPVADGDQIAREVVQPGGPCLYKLAEAFGGDILLPDGTLNRARLAQKAFAQSGGAEKLNEITHPVILEEMFRRATEAEQQGAPLFFVDAAVVVGGTLQDKCDAVIVVDAPDEVLIRRICARDGISPEAAAARLSAQLPQAALRAGADYVIENDDDEEHLYAQAARVLAQLEQVNRT